MSNGGDARGIKDCLTFASPLERAVVVSEDGVEVELSINSLAAGVEELGSEDTVLVDGDVFGATLEAHFGGWKVYWYWRIK